MWGVGSVLRWVRAAARKFSWKKLRDGLPDRSHAKACIRKESLAKGSGDARSEVLFSRAWVDVFVGGQFEDVGTWSLPARAQEGIIDLRTEIDGQQSARVR